ncbi:MAG: hypothetical protein M3N98_09050 [Actinomycetota bacterium]|nr:hypothetical protein [Actinomycetota bacterium]
MSDVGAGPGIADALRWDPTLPLDPRVVSLLIADQRRWSRRLLLPAIRLGSRGAVAAIVAVKRLVPWQWSSHRSIDRLAVWFLRRFASPETGELLLRHFVVETGLINFIAAHAGLAAGQRADLIPVTLDQLGDDSVIRHDLNVYALAVNLGRAGWPGTAAAARECGSSFLAIPALNAEPERRRWLNLDVQSALCLMNIPFAFWTTEDEYERAVNSFQLDDMLMACLTRITGDPTFMTWRAMAGRGWLGIARDVPRELYWHALVNEYAHTHLRRRLSNPGALKAGM